MFVNIHVHLIPQSTHEYVTCTCKNRDGQFSSTAGYKFVIFTYNNLVVF